MASDVEYWQRWKGREGLAVPRQRCWRCRRSSEGFAKVGGGAAAHSACNDQAHGKDEEALVVKGDTTDLPLDDEEVGIAAVLEGDGGVDGGARVCKKMA